MLTHGIDWSKMRGSAEALKWNRRDLPHLERIMTRARGKRVVVQAGGNLGIYPKRLAQSFAAVYTFEPGAALFPIMVQNAPEPNIHRYQAALGFDRALVGTSQVRRDSKPNCHEGITHISGGGTIPTMRIDDFALPCCDLICLDVEGFEMHALRGAVDTVARCRPLLSVEINKNQAFVGIDEDDIRRLVVGWDYVFVERLGSDEVFQPREWEGN